MVDQDIQELVYNNRKKLHDYNFLGMKRKKPRHLWENVSTDTYDAHTDMVYYKAKCLVCSIAIVASKPRPMGGVCHNFPR